jgi:HD superfamily phosphodiesterase
MKNTRSIKSAEDKYKQKLELFFTGIYNDKILPSHGLDHHRRVWNYTKEILTLPGNEYVQNDEAFFCKLIIVCYLHDIGMSVETGVKHGLHSSDICKTFLRDNNLNVEDYQDVILAIENHDAKEYPASLKSNKLLNILSVADDLDAFGFTGVFRYAEIYLERRVSLEKIGQLIIENAATRFENFSKHFSSNDAFFNKHKQRYGILKDFFTGYNKQLPDYRFKNKSVAGYCGIIELMSEGKIKPDSPAEVFVMNKETISDPVIKWYISGLEEERMSERS